ncbi:hypothetical protein XENTR_v10021290 [Xenopus tropicalis]|uniref:G patch domain and ankyrin repeat-containing protein 1 n=1 Tax=Xenopus tropicalis TaxID=8364 RepID=Q0V9D4_XENTR|eukprot:NP_001072407.1 G patch domain and ankyrin repeat-containing protein 1 [Xenopus tropicalis]
MNHLQLITFTKARDKSDFWENGECSNKKDLNASNKNITGEEARSFYESLLETEDQQSHSKKSSRKPKPAILSVQHRVADTQSEQNTTTAQDPKEQHKGHQLLRCSQEGDLKGLKRLVDKEKCNINFHDSYYWTALMCAAYGGRKEVVGYLLQRGAAWVGVCETQGRDALTLAEEAGHGDIVQLFQSSLTSPKKSVSRKRPLERKYCEVCKSHYQEDTVETHERSTVHLFNNKKQQPATYYAIPDHNVGFKMMLKEGWNRESGLGPDGEGRKFPVKTLLKRDKKGLGFHTDQKSKVTHFSANDNMAVANVKIRQKRTERISTISRKEEKRKQAKEQAWERNLRTYMNIDL